MEKETPRKKYLKNSNNRIFSPFFIKKFQRFSKTKYYGAKIIVLTTSSNLVSTAFIALNRNIHIQ